MALLIQQGNFNSSVGPDGYMLSALTCGMSPVTSITEGLQQVLLFTWILTQWISSSLPGCCCYRAVYKF